MVQQSHFCVYTSKGNEITILKRLFHDHIHRSVRHNNLRVYHQMDEQRKCGIGIKQNIIQPQKEGSPAICDNLDDFRALQYVK